MRGTLTGIVDTDMLVLKNLDDRSLLSLCSVDRYTNSLCRRENFWLDRTKNKYGNIYKYKPGDMTWKNFYLKILVELNSEIGIEDFPNLIVIYQTIDNIFIQYCDNIKTDKILVVTNEIRTDMINHYIAIGAVDACPICRDKLSEVSTRCEDRCFLKDIRINDINNTFKASITCPIVKGECNHIYHNNCINGWRKKRDVCPVDNQKWIPLEMDSFVTGIVDNKY